MTKLSISVKLNTKGLDTLTGRAKTMPGKILDVAARNVERGWKTNIREVDAIDTGAYVNSVHVMPTEKELERTVADGVEYGIFVDQGTTRMAGRPCVVPAVEAERKPLVQAWEAMFDL